MAELARLEEWSAPFDGPGPDTGERHGPVVVTILLEYHEPSNKARRRGGLLYPREDVRRRRAYRYPLDRDLVYRPGGEAELVTRVARLFHRDLRWEGWPAQERTGVGNIRSYRA